MRKLRKCERTFPINGKMAQIYIDDACRNAWNAKRLKCVPHSNLFENINSCAYLSDWKHHRLTLQGNYYTWNWNSKTEMTNARYFTFKHDPNQTKKKMKFGLFIDSFYHSEITHVNKSIFILNESFMMPLMSLVIKCVILILSLAHIHLNYFQRCK